MRRGVAAIVVNYNNDQDTIECLGSLACSSDFDLTHVFLIDNSTTDEFAGRISAWAESLEEGRALPSGNNDVRAPCTELRRIAAQPSFSVVDYVFADLKRSARRRFTVAVINEGDPAPGGTGLEAIRLVLIKSRANRGYAGGINIGLTYGLRLEVAVFWVLNNDTIVHSQACLELKKRLLACHRPGLAGGLVLYHDHPSMVQCQAGGYTSPVFFLSRLFGHMLSVEKALAVTPETVERRINFIYGASFMMSRELTEHLGRLDERLFLYCEEQDIAWFARGKFDLAYAPGAIVLHKEGRSTKLSRYKRPLARLALIARNKILVTLKHHPWALPTVILGICFSAVRNYMRILFRA